MILLVLPCPTLPLTCRTLISLLLEVLVNNPQLAPPPQDCHLAQSACTALRPSSPGPSHEVMTEVHGAASLPPGGINSLLQFGPHCFLEGSEEVSPPSRLLSCLNFILALSCTPHAPLPDSTFSNRSLQQESAPEEPD